MTWLLAGLLSAAAAVDRHAQLSALEARLREQVAALARTQDQMAALRAAAEGPRDDFSWENMFQDLGNLLFCSNSSAVRDDAPPGCDDCEVFCAAQLARETVEDLRPRPTELFTESDIASHPDALYDPRFSSGVVGGGRDSTYNPPARALLDQVEILLATPRNSNGRRMSYDGRSIIVHYQGQGHDSVDRHSHHTWVEGQTWHVMAERDGSGRGRGAWKTTGISPSDGDPACTAVSLSKKVQFGSKPKTKMKKRPVSTCQGYVGHPGQYNNICFMLPILLQEFDDLYKADIDRCSPSPSSCNGKISRATAEAMNLPLGHRWVNGYGLGRRGT